MKKIRILPAITSICFISLLAVYSGLDPAINDQQGSLVGNEYTIYTYDNYGTKTLMTSGDKVNISRNKTTISYVSNGSKITGYDVASVITITIDGKEIESCGDTCIFVQNGLDAEVDFTAEEIRNNTDGSSSDNTDIAEFVNQYKNLFGKSKVVVIKSQLGQPIMAYSGDEVYWEMPDDLPKMIKLIIDGKALYIHQAKFQIIDKQLLN